MINEEPKLNYKRLFALIAIGIIGTFGLYKLSCSSKRPQKSPEYSTLIDIVTRDLPNNPEYVDILIQRSIDTANKQNIELQSDTYITLINTACHKMSEKPELSDLLPKKVIDYQLEKHKPSIKDYIFGGNN